MLALRGWCHDSFILLLLVTPPTGRDIVFIKLEKPNRRYMVQIYRSDLDQHDPIKKRRALELDSQSFFISFRSKPIWRSKHDTLRPARPGLIPHTSAEIGKTMGAPMETGMQWVSGGWGMQGTMGEQRFLLRAVN
jgi:hypothetical protein